MYSKEFIQDNVDTNVNGNNNYVNNEMDVNVNMANGNQGNMMTGGCMNNGRERIINRTFVHEVPHTCPIHTKIINHHVYKHTYRPVYTCSEENVCSSVQCGSCSQFQ